MTILDGTVDGLVTIAARRWRLPADHDRVREWHGELHALRHEPAVPRVVRAYRQVAFALSLALSRPAPHGGPPPGALDMVWRLLGVLRPVLVLVAVPGAALGFRQGYELASLTSVLSALGTLPNLWIGLVLLAGLVLVAARVFSRAWSAADPARLRLARLVAVPVLLAAGLLLAPVESVPPVAVAACAAILAGAGLWADRLRGAGRFAVLVPAATVATALLVVPVRMALFDGRAAVALAVTLFAAWCAAAATRRTPAHAAVPVTATADANTGVPLVTGLITTVAGAGVLLFSLTISPAHDGFWAHWLTSVRQSAALALVAGLVLVLVAHPRTRLSGERRRRAAAVVAVVAGCCTSGLLGHGRWTVVSGDRDPVDLAPATAILAGALAALCLAAAVAARRAPLRAAPAAALVGGFAAFAAATGALTGSNSDDFVVVVASVVGLALPVPLLLAARRVARGPRPGDVRRALVWTALVVGALLTGVAQLLRGLATFVDNLLTPDGTALYEPPSVLGTAVLALVAVALLASPDRRPASA